MEVYVRDSFRENANIGDARHQRRLYVQGLEELQNMEYYHSVQASKSLSTSSPPPVMPAPPVKVVVHRPDNSDKNSTFSKPAPPTPPTEPAATKTPTTQSRAQSTPATADTQWTCEQVLEWMARVGLAQHEIQLFRARNIHGRLLLDLDHEDLKEIGVSSRLERKRILVEINELLPDSSDDDDDDDDDDDESDSEYNR
jgi:hypothetical protein